MKSLNPNNLYIGDNGRIFCGAMRCSGSSAHYTGRDLSGAKVERLSVAAVKELRGLIQREPSCESCGKQASLVVVAL